MTRKRKVQPVSADHRTPPSLLDPAFEYTSHAKTNVQNTWRKFGWEQPCPDQQAEIRAKLNQLH